MDMRPQRLSSAVARLRRPAPSAQPARLLAPCVHTGVERLVLRRPYGPNVSLSILTFALRQTLEVADTAVMSRPCEPLALQPK